MDRSRLVALVVGVGATLAGAALTLRPFSSLDALALLVGVSLALAGVSELLQPGRPSKLAGAVLLVTGALAVALPDATVRSIALVVGVGAIIGGGLKVVAGLRGIRPERYTAVVGGLAGVVAGALALGWPDVTILVVALLAGPVAVISGVELVVRSVRGPRREEGGPPSRVGRWLRAAAATAALGLALVLVAVSAAVNEESPVADAFYQAPRGLPDEPGALVREERFTRALPPGAEAWRILYTTTGADGEIEVASGLVIAPADRAGPSPALLWAHGTTGVATDCAPSALADPFTAGALFVLPEILEQGWTVVAPDYPGLGTAGEHPYLVGAPAARAALDAVRAARALPDLRLGDETVVWGHSQGGGAALWVGQEATRYAPDVPLGGVAALAPASDVHGLAAGLQASPAGMLFASFVVRGYSAFYDDVRFEDYVRPSARAVLERVVGRCLSEPATIVSLGAVLTGEQIYRGDLAGGALGARLRENVPLRLPGETPVLLAQGEADELVLPDVQRDYIQRACEAGASIDFRTYRERDHVALVAADSPLIPELVAWTRDRLDDRPAPAGCVGTPAG